MKDLKPSGREWFAQDFDHPEYFRLYSDKEDHAEKEGRGLAAILDLPPGALILDLPCGWGRLQPFLEERGLRIIGGDLSPRNLKRHREEFPAPLVRLDLRRLPFLNACADGVLCAFTSWGYFQKPEDNTRQIQEYARVLKPGGVLVLDLAGRDYLWAASKPLLGQWIQHPGREYLERVHWSEDGKRIHSQMQLGSAHFHHDIWIPSHQEIETTLQRAGFGRIQVFGGLEGQTWRPMAKRWIYRAEKAGIQEDEV